MAFKIKSFFTVFFTGLIMSVGSAYANISTVGYVHDTILSQKGITIPIAGGISRDQPHSVKYLMRQIDAANATLGNITTHASTASQNLMEPAKVLKDVKDLVEPKSFKITIKNVNEFILEISAAGNWLIDWGDGYSPEPLNHSNLDTTNFLHEYDSVGDYVIKIFGTATGYFNDTTTPVLSFVGNDKIVKIEGSLGTIFPTVAGVNPSFYQTFAGCNRLTSIPSDLFAGLNGAPVKNMFKETFSRCSGLTGLIPSDLFSGISGVPAEYMFYYTFYGCYGLTGSIPAGLFSGISGVPAEGMFCCTFGYCSGLTSIPSGLFSGISGAPAQGMFALTFVGCDGLSGSIPSDLFAGINGVPANTMFANTFEDCYGLTGSIPVGLFSGIYGDPTEYMFEGTFSGCSGLTGSIPYNLFSGISGAPANNMFSLTFSGCSGLTSSIPSGLFGNISGAPAMYMFADTFSGCSGLTSSIPTGLFGVINGIPADSMFEGTFADCSGLTGSIPSGLFGDINGPGGWYMFYSTFAGCSGLTGLIPSGLFGVITYTAGNMFQATFLNCSNIAGVEAGIWDLSGVIDVDDPEHGAFSYTFAGCVNMRGLPPKVSYEYGANLWYFFSSLETTHMFQGCTGLDYYANIPTGWK